MKAPTAWGWDEAWSTTLGVVDDDTSAARVTAQQRDRWEIQADDGSHEARIPTSDRFEPRPVVGDWVLARPGPTSSDPWSITRVLPRRSRFSRGSAGTGTAEQVLAANIDRVWIVQGLDMPPNRRRLERYLAVAWESGASPEVVLTKADLTGDAEARTAEVRSVAVGIPVWTVSASTRDGLADLRGSLQPGRTIVLLGPSGVGKSTLVNALAEADLAATAEVRGVDGKGRHTTTHRELFRIAGGALLVDTPGIRELRVWDLGEGLDHAFPEIEELARECRFRDCRHESEPGCGVTGAVADGRLDAARLESFRKLRAEVRFHERKSDPRARAEAVAEHKTALKTVKYHPKYQDRS